MKVYCLTMKRPNLKTKTSKKEKMEMTELTRLERNGVLSLKLDEVPNRENWAKCQDSNRTVKSYDPMRCWVPIFAKQRVFFQKSGNKNLTSVVSRPQSFLKNVKK